jgi:FKBP12-rapamycin complex-associated protein
MGENETIDKLLTNSFELIDLDSWLLVIPQLLARVNIIDERIKNSLVSLLKKIGNTHPRALIYPLIAMNKARSKKRRFTAEAILDEMNKKYKTLIEECSLIIEELNRSALLLHEEWIEAIEESAKMYFQSNEIKGMIKILMEVHEKMDKIPETMNEIHFHQLYASDLTEAQSYLKRYIETMNEMDLKQAWDIYHSVFKSMNESFTDVKYLDLENVSPKLYNFKESELCVPGLYKSGYPVIKIAGFEKQLTVFQTKQHPRKTIVNGADGKDYMFLLKGHEDLRQDERAMQLFGLVNTLLANDPDTNTKNLFIKRFPVIPLSHNTGFIGWVPSCDTLHQLIKEYRTLNKIIPNVEHRLMFTICPRFDTSVFMNKLEVFKCALQHTLGYDLYKILWKKSKNSEAWLDRRTNYSRSLAVMSMVGYILGLGDRHPSNLMLDRNSGKIIHIDFGDCFEVAMKREKYPERVPFRLTRMLIKALEVSGIEGTFRITCENVMRVLRANKDSLIAILAAFVHDPLISFRLLIPLILKANRTKRGINTTDEKITSESLRNERPDDIKITDKRKSVKIVPAIGAEFNATEFDDTEPRRRKMESTERQLFNLFEERGIYNLFDIYNIFR